MVPAPLTGTSLALAAAAAAAASPSSSSEWIHAPLLADRQRVSDLLGGASIVCWLFAQFPQLVVNHRNASVEGLALPFLLSWLCGDFTNLVGCLLTDQLPFQTYLAAYFCLVDVALVAQFVQYSTLFTRSSHIKDTQAHEPPAVHHAHVHRRHYASSRTRRNAGGQALAATSQPHHRHGHNTGPSMSASWLSERSLSPATLKRVAASRAESFVDSKRRRKAEDGREAATDTVGTSLGRRASPAELDGLPANSDEDLAAPPDMMASVHSERSHASTSTLGTIRRGRNPRRTVTAQSAPLYALAASASERVISDAGLHQQQPDGRQPVPFVRDRSGSKMRAPSASRSRSVIFLSLFAFIGIGSLVPLDRSFSHEPVSPVTALASNTAWRAPRLPEPVHIARDISHTVQDVNLATVVPYVPSKVQSTPKPGPVVHPVDYQRLIGRLSAWICVVFYLTSRMPQIWKNFRRRSVEGLSMLLFVAAFHGNLFYVLSIVSNPLATTEEGYFTESLPFLLGSGGTLAFDLTILFQSLIYGKRQQRARHRALPSKASDMAEHNEEAAALLDGHDDVGPSRASRSRSASQRQRSTSLQSVRGVSL